MGLGEEVVQVAGILSVGRTSQRPFYADFVLSKFRALQMSQGMTKGFNAKLCFCRRCLMNQLPVALQSHKPQ